MYVIQVDQSEALVECEAAAVHEMDRTCSTGNASAGASHVSMNVHIQIRTNNCPISIFLWGRISEKLS